MIAFVAGLLMAAPVQAPVITRATPKQPETEASAEPFADAEPDVVVRGRSVKLVVKGRDAASLKTLSVSPPEGVTLGAITPLPTRADGSAAVAVEVTVDAGASPGERALMLTAAPKISSSSSARPGNDSASKAMAAMMEALIRDQTKPAEAGVLYINSHEIVVSGVEVGKGPRREVRVIVTDTADDVESPASSGGSVAPANGIVVMSLNAELIRSEARCGNDVYDGVLDDARVTQTRIGSAVLVATLFTVPPHGPGSCTLRVRVHDTAGNTSPWFTSKLDLR
jgi:hypothetical protein